MFYRLRNTIARFMYGRYGLDNLGKFSLVIYLALMIIINILARSPLNIRAVSILNILAYIFFFLILFRILSRNIPKRYAENQKYLNIKYKIVRYFSNIKVRFRERKTHIYKKCPNCKATLRLPRKKGKHVCCCPKCKKDFKVRVF